MPLSAAQGWREQKPGPGRRLQWLTELSRSFAARQRVSVLATAHNTRAGRGAQVPVCNTEQLCARRRHRLSLDADPCALHRPRKVPPRGAVPAFLGRLRNSHSDCGPEKPKFLNLTQPSHESEPTGAARETGGQGEERALGRERLREPPSGQVYYL